MIAAEGVRVVFGRTVALDEVNLEISPGIAGLFGPNGSGKSTLLRVVAGLLSPSAGRVTIAGRPASIREESVRRLIGYSGHEAGLYPQLSVAENLRLFAHLSGADPARIGAVLESVGLEDRANARASDLSAGLKRRASVARALVGDPRILILDEPYANLDDDSAALVTRAVKAWWQPDRVALIATHGAKRLKEYADASIVLRRGLVASHRVSTREVVT